jgi:hypothetical protein
MYGSPPMYGAPPMLDSKAFAQDFYIQHGHYPWSQRPSAPVIVPMDDRRRISLPQAEAEADAAYAEVAHEVADKRDSSNNIALIVGGIAIAGLVIGFMLGQR